ncbi:DUF6504 family protein [Phenylobacterium sp.]|uniref:DUF6504 family protein n=1 Tax=Phenylobacterium sp. TaxID=1871053 RepID=UPI0027368A00|nr:DUF6504 family protein [Phenylobacterium sp.]MDP3658494.1 DNA polymerase Y family protein [Phenylobacterium sp.]
MGRILCAWSPNWAIDNWRRRNPSAPQDRPFALVETARGVRRLAAVDEAARALGLFAGQKAADAAALVPELDSAEAEPAADLAALEALADWCVRFSPAVAPDAPDGLLLDVEGVSHLWGGEGALMADFRHRLGQGGIGVRLALADTPGAAWALAHHGVDGTIAAVGEQAPLLAPLPPAALRLEPQAAAQIERLGLKRLGQLMKIPRAPLGRRFGAATLMRLDQALGRAREALAFRRPATPWFARLAFAEPISAPEDMGRVSRDILEALCARLDDAGQGARRFEMAFHRVDGQAPSLSVGLAFPGRDARRLARLFAPKLETVDPGFGIEVVTLSALDVEPLAGRQTSLRQSPSRSSSSGLSRGSMHTGDAEGTSALLRFPGASVFMDPRDKPEDDGRKDEVFQWDLIDEAELAPLVDRLANRLGEERVWKSAAFESHVPELASIRAPPLAGAPHGGWDPDLPRPLRLFRRPEAIEVTAPVPDDPPIQFRWRGRVHRVSRSEGPERIAEEWWKAALSAASPAHVRDYYRVEDQEGGRFWVFRAGLYEAGQPARWWLHGLFG